MRFAAGVGAALAATALLVALLDPEPDSLLRHAYLVPIVAAALRFGTPGGAVAGGAGLMLYAPAVLSHVERGGLDAASGEGLVTLVMLASAGPLTGHLVGAARRERARHATLRAVQHTLAGDAPLDVALERLRDCLEPRLRAAVGLVVRDERGVIVVGARRLHASSLAARVLDTGVPVFAADGGGAARPRRALGIPLTAGGATIGVLAVERTGELGAEERAALCALGAHIGLGLENARLSSRQRHFADELGRRVTAATARLEEADRAKSAFVATASHELRTPLTALRGFSELLATRDLPAAEVRRFAAILGREIERLTRIVDDFLDVSRLERGLAPTLHRVPVALPSVVASAVELFRRHAARCHISADCADGLPALDADPDALDRILTNLLSNAVKYARPGGRVRVSARATADGRRVALAVEDDGRGIAPEALPRVFEPYYRAPDAAGAARGTGIGLAIVKALVEAHGGTIDVASEPARGTRVTLTLPALP